MGRNRLNAEERAARRTWEAFVSGGAPDLAALPAAIRASWLRSQQHGIDPRLTHAPLAVAGDGHDNGLPNVPWGATLDPAFQLLAAALAEPHQVLLVADRNGRAVRVHHGPAARHRARELNIVTGAEWGEATVGCTALGACLHDGVPVSAGRYESYGSSWHDWAAQAVPLRDPATGSLLGAINVSGLRENLHPAVLDLGLRAGEAIERALAERDWRLRARVLERFHRQASRYPNDACLALDRRGNLVVFNDAAARRYGLRPEHTGAAVATIEALAEDFDRDAATDDGFHYRARPRDNVEYAEVLSDDFRGAIFTVPTARRPSRASGAWRARYSFSELRGASGAFMATVAQAQRLAPTSMPLLLCGETGTGKELLAHAIHAGSERAAGPFVTVNCGAIPEDLVASELFGYEKGAFTGANRQGQRGKFEQADGGTIFLDEITETSHSLQVALLRVIQDHEVVPIGADRARPVDVRIISATNREPEEAMHSGTLRRDLYYRLSGAVLMLPPLRERQQDIAVLARHFCIESGRVDGLTDEALAVLEAYEWPGNLRELHAVIRSAAALADEGRIGIGDLPGKLRESVRPGAHPTHALDLASTEVMAIERAMLESRGNVRAAATLLGISRSTLYRKLQKFRLERGWVWQ